jgi:hypothetical protein
MATPSSHPSRTAISRAAAIFALALGLPFGGTAVAQDSDYRLFDRWSFVVGGYFESSDTDLRIDGTTARLGSAIDFEGELGLDSSDSLFRARVEFLPGTRHQFNFGYYALDRDASRVLSRDVEFGGQVFPISAEVSAFADLEVIEGSYTYWFLRKERYGFGGSLGLVYLGIDAGLAVTAGSVGAGVEDSESTDLPVPVLGLAYKVGLLEQLSLHAYADFLPSVDVGDAEGSLTNVTAALEYRPFEHAGFGASYNLLDIDVDVDKGGFRGAVDYSIEGYQLYLRFGF